MADPLSLTASIIAIAGLAYQSSKNLYEVLNSIQNAPKTLQVLKEDISTIQHLLISIKRDIEDSSENSFSNGVKKCLEEAKLVLAGLTTAADEFSEKIGKIMSHSNENHISARDRFKLRFEEKDILAFKYRIGTYKATLNIMLALASLKMTSQSQNSIGELQATIEKTMSGISGQIQGLEMSIHTVVESSPDKSEVILDALKEHNTALGQCLKTCMSALVETSTRTSTTIKYAAALDEARQLIGNIGKVELGGEAAMIEVMIAKDRAVQFGGNISADVAIAMLNAPRS